MSKQQRIALIGTALTVALCLSACGGGAEGTPPTPSASPSVQESTPASSAAPQDGWSLTIETTTLDGEAVTQDTFKDNALTVLNVWGTWCPPCVGELPHLQEVSERLAEDNVQIVGVLQDGVVAPGQPDDAVIDAAKTLLADAGATYTVILPDETIMTEFIAHMQYFPTTFFIDPQGEVVHVVTGANDADKWEAIIRAVLQDAA